MIIQISHADPKNPRRTLLIYCFKFHQPLLDTRRDKMLQIFMKLFFRQQKNPSSGIVLIEPQTAKSGGISVTGETVRQLLTGLERLWRIDCA
jgi:hypothetical protein